jgi:uncharacterized protein DUF6600
MARAARFLLVALLAVALLLRARSARAQDDWDDGGYGYGEVAPPDDAPDPSTLAPYGAWMDDPQYGRVWRPAVAVGWQPYVAGYWTSTPYGWTWVSAEPWAWTFHYGRWAPTVAGWVWVPGTVWGPAWVDWYWGDGFVGWAPLGPFVSHVAVIDHFVFVHERDFCSRGLSHLVVDHHLVPDRVIHGWGARDERHERAPGLHRIEHVSASPVQRYERRPPGTFAPGRQRQYRAAGGDRPFPARQWEVSQPRTQRLGRAYGLALRAAPIVRDGPTRGAERGLAQRGGQTFQRRPAAVPGAFRVARVPGAPRAGFHGAPHVRGGTVGRAQGGGARWLAFPGRR